MDPRRPEGSSAEALLPQPSSEVIPLEADEEFRLPVTRDLGPDTSPDFEEAGVYSVDIKVRLTLVGAMVLVLQAT